MPYTWTEPDVVLQFFAEREFTHPALMDPDFLGDLDTLRMRCGFGLTVTNDARSQKDLERIYAVEIAKGQPYPTDSAHLYIAPTLVRAVDLKPAIANDLEERQLELTHQILVMRDDGTWPNLGLGIETAHWHIDDTPRLGAKRPAFWVAVSK